MSYGYSGGPNWPMIQAKRRAEQEASSARSEISANRASAERWKAAFEALSGHVRTAAGRSGMAHREGDRCGCPACWEKVIAGLAQEAEERAGAAGGPGAHAGPRSSATSSRTTTRSSAPDPARARYARATGVTCRACKGWRAVAGRTSNHAWPSSR